MTDVRAIFDKYRGAVGSAANAVKAALDNDPNDAGLSQDTRLRAWIQASQQFCDPNYWVGAVDVHAATVRARHADRQRQLADATAQDAHADHTRAAMDAAERHGQLAVNYPPQKY